MFLALLFDILEEGIGMVWIVVGESESPDLRPLRYFDGLFPAAVTPTSFAEELVGGVLGIVDEEAGALGKLNDALVNRLSVFDVGTINERFPFVVDAIGVGATGMIMSDGGNFGELAGEAVSVQFVKEEFGTHLFERDGEVGFLHLGFENCLEIERLSLFADGANGYIEIRSVGGAEKWESLNMVPVEVGKRDEKLTTTGMFIWGEVFAEIPDSGAGVEDADISIVQSKLDTSGIASKFLKLGLADGYRTPSAVKLHFHR